MTKKRQKASRQAKANEKQQRITRGEPESTKSSSEQKDSSSGELLEASRITNQYLFFFRENVEPWGFLSNWYQPASFRDPTSGHIFANSEQFMMYHKALLAESETLASVVLKTPDPRKTKGLGREAAELPSFNREEWIRLKQWVVREGCYLKFSQNEALEEKLLGTGNKILVEASPFDRVWGIGFDKAHALSREKEWGESLLGCCLMRVRDRLRRKINGETVGEEEWRTDWEIELRIFSII